MTLPRGRASKSGSHGHVVSYHHGIHSLRKKPFALLGLIYRDQLFPRQACADMFVALLDQTCERTACRVSVALLALVHDQGCVVPEAHLRCAGKLAARLEEDLRQNRLRDLPAHDQLLQNAGEGVAA